MATAASSKANRRGSKRTAALAAAALMAMSLLAILWRNTVFQSNHVEKSAKKGRRKAQTWSDQGALYAAMARVGHYFGFQGGLSVAVGICLTYLYRHQVAFFLRLIDLDFLANFLEGPSDLSLDDEEEDVSDMPELIDAPLAGKMNSIDRPPSVDPLDDEDDRAEALDHFASSPRATNTETGGASSPTMTSGLRRRRGGSSSRLFNSSPMLDDCSENGEASSPTVNSKKWPSTRLTEASLVPTELAPDFYPPPGWRCFDPELGMVPRDLLLIWEEEKRNRKSAASKSSTTSSEQRRTIPPVRNLAQSNQSHSHHEKGKVGHTKPIEGNGSNRKSSSLLGSEEKDVEDPAEAARYSEPTSPESRCSDDIAVQPQRRKSTSSDCPFVISHYEASL